MIKLSIIVPVYNVEKYIRPCIESIFMQEIDDNTFEMIIVNDGTKDRSMEMIADIINQHDNITVINQENQGLSVARNNGLAAAKGEYVFMPDSDDLLIENSLKPLLDRAIESQADLIVADFLKVRDEEINDIYPISQKNFCIEEKNGPQLFLEDLNPHECFVWRTLYRREFLINYNLTFYSNIRYQDIPFTHRCYLKAGKCLRISWLFYIYRKRQGAATYLFTTAKAKDFCTAIAETWNLSKIEDLNPTTVHKLQDDIWTSFSEMICLACHNIKKSRERNDIIDFLQEEAPDISFQNGKKQKIVSFLYRNIPHVYIHIRYLYAIIFEDNIRPFYYKWLRRPFIRI